jgi:hypothetical protein
MAIDLELLTAIGMISERCGTTGQLRQKLALIMRAGFTGHSGEKIRTGV